MTSTNKATALFLFFALVLLTAPAHAATFDWDGNQNNNWDNGSNWTGTSGWPDGTTDDAVFDDSNYGTNDRELDLRSGNFDIRHLKMSGAGEPLLFRTGTLRLNGNMDFAVPLIGGTGVGHTFASDLTLVVVGNSTWQGGPQHRVAISGELQGSGNITTDIIQTAAKGSEIIRLNAANSYSGTLTINDGYVTIADTNALQNAQVTLNWDNGLRMNNDIDANIGRLSGSGNLNIGAGTFSTDTSLNSSFSGNITGNANGQFRKKGTGTLTLTGDISNIDWVQNGNGGNLTLDGNSATITELVAALGELTLQNGADVNMSGSGIARSGSVGTLKVTGAGTQLRNGAELAATNGTGEGTINILFSAEVSGFDIVTAGKLGTGDIIVQQNATLSADALGLGGKDVLENGGTGSLSVLSGGHVDIAGETRLWTNSSSLFVFSDGTMTTGTLTSPGGTSPTIQLADPSGGGPALTIGTNDPVALATFNGVIQDLGMTPSSIEKLGTNTQVLTGNNTFTGGITINGGTLGLAHNNAAGTGAITVLGSTIDYADTVNISNPIDLQNNVTLNIDTGSATQSGVIGETGSSFDITKTGAGSLMLSAVNTFTGTTRIDAGQIVINGFALQNSTVQIDVNNGLGFSGVANVLIGGLSGAGDLDLGSVNLLVGNNSASTTYSGILSGTGELNKTGAGTLTLTAANTYSGGTTIDGGTLLANNTSGSATGSSSVAVNTGGTLAGTGSVAGIVTVNSGGTLAPGVSPGTLTVEDIVFNAGSTFAVELTGNGGVAGVDFDQLVVNNGATLGGTLDVSLVNPFTLSPGLSFEIVDVAGSLTGTFSGLSQGALVGNFGGTDLFIDYTSGDGNDISLVATQTGDFDFDFNVDGFDFLKWQRGFGDIYDSADLADWEDNFGTAAPLSAVATATTAVPEPSTGIMLLLGMVTVLADRRKARSKPNTL